MLHKGSQGSAEGLGQGMNLYHLGPCPGAQFPYPHGDGQLLLRTAARLKEPYQAWCVAGAQEVPSPQSVVASCLCSKAQHSPIIGDLLCQRTVLESV